MNGRMAIALRKYERLQDGVGINNQKAAGVLLAFAGGWMIWHMTPPPPLDENAMLFLATLAAGVILWAFEAFDEYIVGLMLLLSWLLFGIAPTEVVLSGFSKSAWFFVVGVFGMAAAVTTSGLLKRVTLHFLRNVRPTYRWYTYTLGALGFLLTPLLPNTKGRMGIVAPLTQSIAKAIGLGPRSNGAAGLTLSAYAGLSQLNMLFLTGATTCLVGWSLLPNGAKAEFGWGTWLFAALPAGIVNFLLLLIAIQFLFRVGKEDHWIPSEETGIQLESLGPLTRNEWFTLCVVSLTLLGWITKSLHGTNQAWLALGALVALLLTGVLDKKNLKNNIDWSFLLFFGIVYSLAGLSSHLEIDVWLKEWMSPILSAVSFHPLAFLMTALLLVYLVRFFMFKTPTVILFSLILTPWAQQLGIHPGVLLLTVLMGLEVWFFSYQQPSYQIAYYSTEGKAFSHAQGRKLMAVKFVASLIALVISVPYWTALGFIKEPTGLVVHTSAPLSHKGAARAVVAEIQALLSRLGYSPGPIDGILGPRTRAAIGRYQKKSRIRVDRKASKTLLVHLNNAVRR